MKMERSFFLKKRRADFVAGPLSGRVIVAGGLGEYHTSGSGGVPVLGGTLGIMLRSKRLLDMHTLASSFILQS